MVSNIYKNTFDPYSIALKYKGEQTTYGELDQNVQKYATYFTKIGVKKGDKIVLSCLNSPEFIYSYLGAIKIGAIIVPVNLLLTFDEIIYIIKNSDAKTMIFHPTVLEKIKSSKQISKKLAVSLLENIFFEKLIKLFFKINIIVLNQSFKNAINKITDYNFEEVDKIKL